MPVTVKRPSKWESEELILYGLLVVIGAIPVVITLFQGVVFDVEATIGLFMVCAGLVGVVFRAVRSRQGRTG